MWKNLLNTLFCSHKWNSIAENYSSIDNDKIKVIEVFICNRCNKLKKKVHNNVKKRTIKEID